MSHQSNSILSLNQVTDYSSDHYLKAMQLYNGLFPPEEKKAEELVKDLLNKGIYRLHVLQHNSDQQIIGFTLAVFNNEPNFLLIDNLAIDRKYQGSGFGTELIRLLAEKLDNSSLGMLIEVERPELAVDCQDRMVRENRLHFYHLLHFRELHGINYQFPAATGKPIPFALMFRPAPGVNSLSAKVIKQMIKAGYNNIHSEIDDLDQIFDYYVDTISDQFFRS